MNCLAAFALMIFVTKEMALVQKVALLELTVTLVTNLATPDAQFVKETAGLV